MQVRWLFVKNAIANLGRGSAAALVALLLPPILVRHMPPAAYAVWVLVLQTAAYASYLNFGLQTAVGRYVAYANEKQDIEQRDTVFSTAFAALCGAAILSLICLAAATVAVPAIFPKVPPALIPQMRLALVIVGIAMAVDLPASAWSGVFIGIQRYEIPAIAVGGARLLSAFGVIAAALAGRSIATMAAIIASANLVSYLAQYLTLRRIVPGIRFHRSMVRGSTARELYGYCFGLTVMSFATLLVNGLDLILVGRFEFSAVTAYSVSASMIAFISGLIYAVVNVIMPHAAALHARQKANELGSLVIDSTRITVLVLILTGLPLLLCAAPILRLWIGPQYVKMGAPILATLVVANIIRLIGAPYSTLLIASGQQSYIKISPLSEGISNFVASVVLGTIFGAIGVALGTLLGSLVSVGSHLWYSMPRTRTVVDFSRRTFVVQGVLTPLLWTSPLMVAAAAVLVHWEVRPFALALCMLLSCAGAARLLLRDRKFAHGKTELSIASE